MKGDGYIKIILKFLNVGIKNKYQANIKIYDGNKKIIESKTYNGEICLTLEKNKIYGIKATFLNNIINTYFYTNSDLFIFKFTTNEILARTIILSLTDYYYNIPIERGEIILWQR